MQFLTIVDLLCVVLFQNFNQDIIKMQFKLRFKNLFSLTKIVSYQVFSTFPKNSLKNLKTFSAACLRIKASKFLISQVALTET